VLWDADAQTTLQGHSPDVADMFDDGSVGLTDPHRLVILLDNTLAEDAFKVTLLHEVMHAIADAADLHDEATEEDWATRGAPYLLDTLRRNPDLVSFLLG
jgi:hypothetical protein